MLDVHLIGAPAFVVGVGQGRFTFAAINRALEEVSGLKNEKLAGRSPWECLNGVVAARAVRQYEQCIQSRTATEYEDQFERSGERRWLHVTLTPVYDESGSEVVSLIGIGLDISRRKRAELKAKEESARVALAMEALDGGFWHYAIATHRFQASVPLARMLAGPDAEVQDADQYFSFVIEDDLNAVDLSPLIEGRVENGVCEYRVKTVEDQVKWIRCRRRLIRDQAGEPHCVVGVAVNVTEQRATQDRLEQQAVTDVLTGVSNRRGFYRHSEWLIDRLQNGGRPFGLMLIDLDHFKSINDRHGHAVGDDVLREAARRLLTQVRPGDLVSRLGGDEFTVLIEDASEQLMTGIAKRLVDALSSPIETAGAGQVVVGASVGVTCSLQTDQDIQRILLRADKALYEVKLAGRGAWKIAPRQTSVHQSGNAIFFGPEAMSLKFIPS